jgi:hypothetical protein
MVLQAATAINITIIIITITITIISTITIRCRGRCHDITGGYRRGAGSVGQGPRGHLRRFICRCHPLLKLAHVKVCTIMFRLLEIITAINCIFDADTRSGLNPALRKYIMPDPLKFAISI